MLLMIIANGEKAARLSDQTGMAGAIGPIMALSTITLVVIAFGPINL